MQFSCITSGFFLMMFLCSKTITVKSDKNELAWETSIAITITKHFQWNKFLLAVDEEEKLCHKTILEQFSLNFLSCAVSSVENSFSRLHNFNTIIMLLQKTSNINSILDTVQKKFESRYYASNFILIHRIQTERFQPFFIPHDVNILLIDTDFTKQLWHVYRLHSTFENVIKIPIGFGNTKLNIFKMNKTSLPIPKLMGKQIRLATKTFEPYFSPDKLSPKNGGKPFGVYGEILGTLQSFINFSIITKVTPDNEFGIVTVNKTVTGVLGKLYRNESDIGVALTLSKIRVDLIEFSPELHTMSMKIVYRQIYGTKQRFFYYLEPFSSASWMCIIFLTVTVSILLTITHNYIFKNNNNSCKIKNEFITNKPKQWFNVFMLYLRKITFTLLQTGISVPVRGLSGHMILQIYHLFSLLMFINYSSTLTSILTVSKLYVPFQSLDDLVFDTNYAVSTQKGTSVEEVFKNSQQGALALAWRKMRKNLPKYIVTSNQKGIDLVFKEEAAYIMEVGSITFILKGNCSFRFAKNPVYNTDLCIGYRRGFPYKKLFNKYLQTLKENGILNKISKDNLPGDHNEMCEKTNLFSALKLSKVVGIFFTLIAGVAISLIIFIIEICNYKFNSLAGLIFSIKKTVKFKN